MDATQLAIATHGAQAVYDAANRHMAGDKSGGLASVGLSAATMGDVYAVQSAAYRELGDAAQAIEAAKVSASLGGLR